MSRVSPLRESLSSILSFTEGYRPLLGCTRMVGVMVGESVTGAPVGDFVVGAAIGDWDGERLGLGDEVGD